VGKHMPIELRPSVHSQRRGMIGASSVVDIQQEEEKSSEHLWRMQHPIQEREV